VLRSSRMSPLGLSGSRSSISDSQQL
jgi:hypothetical protein